MEILLVKNFAGLDLNPRPSDTVFLHHSQTLLIGLVPIFTAISSIDPRIFALNFNGFRVLEILHRRQTAEPLCQGSYVSPIAVSFAILEF